MKPNPESTVIPARTRPSRPGWPEIIVGLSVTLAVGSLALLIVPLLPASEPVLSGLVLAGWSVLAPFAGFAAAALIRIRSWPAFSIRRTTWRWLLVGIVAGIVGFILKGVLNAAIIALGFEENAQVPYYEAAGGGILPLVLTFAMISLLVPLGEEFLFRGVVMNGLLRYGAVVAVIASSVVFALFHGINLALPGAVVFGIICAELVRRSGSIWPAVAAHTINNLGLPVFVLIVGTSGM
ncbi:CPBP family intramembrane glutamic endopeptidase [Agromyces laixinhei]|uniref:CPBP family intramembrane glutamic endopeptidase n=1 Tax=Agromyces laixinhei TaxID=2585717 RepID=UPI0012ED6A2E|nr:type II CAAX endopeptidase family protein [Agromyces laixinhei]